MKLRNFLTALAAVPLAVSAFGAGSASATGGSDSASVTIDCSAQTYTVDYTTTVSPFGSVFIDLNGFAVFFGPPPGTYEYVGNFGYGDNSLTVQVNGVEYYNDTFNCPEPDSDDDGVPDSEDKYPNDPNRASGNDADGDGIDDEFDDNDTDGPLGDQDGDGVNNADDKCPNEKATVDTDGDGCQDQAGPTTTVTPTTVAPTTVAPTTVAPTTTPAPKPTVAHGGIPQTGGESGVNPAYPVLLAVAFGALALFGIRRRRQLDSTLS